MKNFSEISVFQSTSKDRIINNAVQKTGLPKQQITNLFEGFQASGMNFTQINESFESLVKTNNITVESFFEPFINAIKNSSDNLPLYNKKSLIDEMIVAINTCVTNNQVDTINLLKIVANVLLLKDKKFEEKLPTDCKDCCSNGSKVLETFNSVIGAPTNISESEKIKSDVALYESLRDILARDNQRWGLSYAIGGRTYEVIMNYIENEINELMNDQNIESKTQDYHDQILLDICQNRLNPMFQYRNTIVEVIPDVQTFVFDLMCLIHNYVENKRDVMSFVSRKKYSEYQDSVKNLFACISSSKAKSRVCLNNCKCEEISQYDRHPQTIFDEIKIDYNKIDLYNYPIAYLSCVDMINIVQNCSTEFNFRIRPYIRNFCTKVRELVGTAERIILEQSKTNKYKNGWNSYNL